MSFLFVLASAFTVGAALLAVTRRHPVYAAAWMMAAMFGIAGIFVLLNAPFLGTLQILLYAGAIVVLFVFVVMLLNPTQDEIQSEVVPSGQRRIAIGAAALLFCALAVTTLGSLTGAASLTDIPEAAPPAAVMAAPGEVADEWAAAEIGTIQYFGRVIYDKHLVAFELLSLLILSSLAGVIVLAKREIEAEGREREGALASRQIERAVGVADPLGGSDSGESDMGLPEIAEPEASDLGISEPELEGAPA